MRTLLLSVVVLLGVTTVPLLSQSKPGKPIVLVGKVIDTQCYLAGMMGDVLSAEHKECAISCAEGGVPLSILEEKTGQLYMTGQNRLAMQTANVLLMKYISERVQVSGRLVEKGGVKMVLIDKVEKAQTP